jgi:hypothetical protein
MASRRSIRRTLLENLISKPRAINIREFRRAQGNLFPGVDSFVAFLSTDSYQEMNESAKTIITRLSHHHHLSPPTRLLFNLLDFEDHYREPIKEGDYIPQDHFVHLVHLYLLGLYFFSYHRSIHKECTTEFNRVRRQWRIGVDIECLKRARPISSYELFGSIWSMFVLYHDLGYPLERVVPAERSNAEKWLYPFSKIKKSLLKDLSLKSLSNLVALSTFLREGSGITLGEMYFDHHDQYYVGNRKGVYRRFFRKPNAPGKSSSEVSEESAEIYDILNAWESAIFVRGISGISSLRSIGTLLPDASVCAVLENEISGDPIVFVPKNSPESDVIWFQEPSALPSTLRKMKSRFFDLAFHEGDFPGETYTWKYFAQNAEEYFESNLKEIIPEHLPGFIKICHRLEKDPDFRVARLIHGDSASDLAYTTYRLLSRTLGYISDEEEYLSDLELLFESYDRSFTSVSKKFPKIVGDCVQDLVRGDIDQGALAPGQILRTSKREDAVTEIVSYLMSRMNTLQELLDASIGPNIRENVELEQIVRDSARSVRQAIEEESVQNIVDLFEGFTFDEDFSLAKVAPQVAGMGQNVANLLKKSQLDFVRIIRDYKPSWAAQDARLKKNFIDHGLAATLILLSASQVYQSCLSRLTVTDQSEAPPDVRLLRLALGTTARADESWLDIEINYLVSQVAMAIFLHNLYPSSFSKDERSYRTSLSKQPFAFLAMLADGLQRWDRRRLASSSEVDISGIIPGSRFDLQIKGDLIYISLRASKLDMNSEDQSLRQGLREYLVGADALIKLDLMESRQS